MRATTRQPYVGPRPFESADRGLFFGREREADDLQSLIMFHRTVLLYAQSGAGKSSLLNTSIVPGLRDSGFAVFPVARVRGAPPAGLPVKNVYVFNALHTMDGSADSARDGGDPDLAALAEAEFAHFLARAAPAGQGPVLVFDQFEELFTAHQERWADRDGFFRQLAEALGRLPGLRVVLSMREDYIAEVDPLVWRLPDGISARYRLELLRRDAALRAVMEPARQCGATVAPRAAEQLVGHLLEINVEGPGGRPQRVKGEYVEPVQLQIVCRRLWEGLPADVELITESHLEQFGDVSEALGAFYEAAVADAARVTGYPEKLVHLGCTQFVTTSGTRSMIHRDAEATGLLPNAVVDVLVDQHLLRAEIRAGARWYEISHDRLIEPVRDRKQNDEELKTLLRTTDLLAAAVEQWVLRREFVSDRHILSAISEVSGELRLTERELEFLAMNSLGAGYQVDAWVERLKREAPLLLTRVLRRASEDPRPEIRCHAAGALGLGVGTEEARLVDLALDDPDGEVREAAAVSLARVDRPALNARMFGRLRDRAGRHRARAAFAHMRNESATRQRAPDLEARWRSISLGDRLLLALTIAWVRFERGWPTLVYVATFGALGGALGCGLVRMVPSIWGYTLSQAPLSGPRLPFVGLFQGGVGGVIWGGAVAGFMSFGWILFRRYGTGILNGRNVANLVLGTFGGLVGGIGVASVIFFVYDTHSLVKVGWLTAGSGHRLGPCLTETGYCLFHPLLGFPFGAGIAIAISAMQTLEHWHRFIDPHVRQGRIVRWRSTLGQIVSLSGLFSIPTAVMLYGLGFVQMAWIGASPLSTFLEVTTVLTGNIGVVAGMMFGQLIMRVGIRIPPRAE